LNLKKSIPCVTQPQTYKGKINESISTNNSHGFILISVLSFILLTTLSIAAILNMTLTQIRMLGSEKSYLENFKLTEQKLINAERLIAQGLDANHLVEIDSFRPKNFRSKVGISSQHLKLTATTQDQQGWTQIQSIIRVDVSKETSSNSKKASVAPRKNERAMHRLEWKKP
jgi:Tfp pilus assembly protein PilX